VPFPTADWKWADLLTIAKKFVKSDANGKQTQFGVDYWLGSWVTWGHLRGNGGEIVSADMKTSKVNSQANIDTLQFLSDLIHKEHVAPAPGQLPQGYAPFPNGAVAMTVDGSWGIPNLRDQIKNKFDWDVQTLPLGSTGKYGVNVEGGAYGIGKTTKHAEESWKLLKAITSQAGIEEIINKQLITLPGRKSAFPNWLQVVAQNGQPPLNAKCMADEAEKTLDPLPAFPYYQEFATVFDNEVAGIMTGEKQASAVVPQLDKDLQAVIDKYKF
jgi:ABC-type glycerol-3-phosphate transport system substrate-binding protein